MDYPRTVVWYIEAREQAGPDKPPQMGSAVAIWLRRDGVANEVRKYLLTAGHVVRRPTQDGEQGYGAVLGEIISFPPGRGFTHSRDLPLRQSGRYPGAYTARVAAICGASEAELSKSERRPTQDWLLLDVDDAAFQDYEAIHDWTEAQDADDLSVAGYPNGAGNWRTNDLVESVESKGFRADRMAAAGMLKLSSPSATAGGMSGGGVFNRQGALVGIHRGQSQASLEFTALNIEGIRQALAARGWSLVSGRPPRPDPLAERRPLGMAFANREKHKSYVVRQLHPENSAFGVVAVSGSGQVGKSYFWSFVQFAAPHLKVNAVRIDLEIEIGISAQGLFNLITNESGLPPPQGVQVDTTATPAWQARELVGRLVGWARAAEQAGSPPLWIMIDHLDKAWPLDALSGAQEFILYLAEAAKSRKVSGLRLFLVGLPQEVTPPWLVDDQGSINIDPLTPEDVEYWLRQELAPADYSADLLKAKALTVLDGRKRALHRRLESAVTELRAQLGGGT